MTSLFSGTVSPSKDGTSSLPRRQNSLAKPPLRALYDLLIAPMEGVSGSWDTSLSAQCPCTPPERSADAGSSLAADCQVGRSELVL